LISSQELTNTFINLKEFSSKMSDSADNDFTPPEGFADISGDGGVYKKVLTEGVGEVTPSVEDSVFVHYTGTLFGGDRDGEKFDSSRDRNEPFSFKLGAGQVIKGWDEAVKTMRRGEVCDIVLRSDYAYGKSGSGAKIPPNAALKFNIELIRWEGEDVSEAKDKGVIKHCLRKGEGYQKPGIGAMVTVNLVGKHEGREFDSRTGVSFEVGLADEAGLPQGVDFAVRSMTKGEKASFSVSETYAQAQNVPANAAVVYELELTDFEKMKESWELNEEEKVAQAELLKAKGTEYFKKSKMRPALTYYNRVVDFLKWDSGFEDKPEELRQQRVALLLAARLNLSLVHFKLGDHRQCIEEADEAIKLNADAAKAYFRRGQARMATHDYDEAREDFEKVAQLEPGNQAAAQQIALAKQRIIEEKNRQKKTFYGMFDKFAQHDSAAQVSCSLID
ncbi:hypothetical protein BOX15_Mlig024991g2, partial [Macrostomum lignano]